MGEGEGVFLIQESWDLKTSKICSEFLIWSSPNYSRFSMISWLLILQSKQNLSLSLLLLVCSPQSRILCLYAVFLLSSRLALNTLSTTHFFLAPINDPIFSQMHKKPTARYYSWLIYEWGAPSYLHFIEGYC